MLKIIFFNGGLVCEFVLVVVIIVSCCMGNIVFVKLFCINFFVVYSLFISSLCYDFFFVKYNKC